MPIRTEIANRHRMTKSDPKDPLIRSLVLLGLIPRYPRSASVQELKTALERRGFSVTARTLQRDLADKLGLRFPLICQNDGQTFRWSFDSQAQINLPALDTAAALAMHLAEGHLRHLLPPGVLAQLEPQFAEARRQLQSLDHNSLSHWAQRVRAIPNGKALLPASVDGQVWGQVAAALLERRQLQVNYLSRSKGETKALRLHPVGLVSRGAVSYLIATVGDYDDLRHFALHRIQHADVLDEAARPSDDFDIDAYIPTAAFTPRQGTGTVELVADVHPQVAWMLRETPLSTDQQLEPLADGDWLRLRASVPDDQETLGWLFSMGEKIKVLTPSKLTDQIRLMARNLWKMLEQVE